MRWRFLAPRDRRAWEDREALEQAIDRWWTEFEARSETLKRFFKNEAGEFDLADWMRQHLNAIHPHLMWEFGPGLTGGHRLVITPEHRSELRSLTQTVIAKAPDLEGWEFYGYRQRETLEEAKALIQARQGGDISDVQAHAAIYGDTNRLEVSFTSASISDSDHLLNSACLLLETLLGEEGFERWVGPIRIRPEPAKGWLGVDRLQARLEALIVSLLDQQPPGPLMDLGDELPWYTYKCSPEPAEDYPGCRDLISGVSMRIEPLRTVHDGRPFDSGGHSRCGEVFAYLKLEAEGEGLQEQLDWRNALMESLDESLAPGRLGGTTGGGTGQRYAYVELALLDPEGAIEVIRPLLQGKGVSRRSWLLFCDQTLREEWVGIWDDTPPPPQPA